MLETWISEARISEINKLIILNIFDLIVNKYQLFYLQVIYDYWKNMKIEISKWEYTTHDPITQ